MPKLTSDFFLPGGDTPLSRGELNGIFQAFYEEIGIDPSSTGFDVDRINPITPGGDVTITSGMVVEGDMEVKGTRTTVKSTVVTIDDPIFTLGGDTAPVADDNKDRGIEFRWHNGSAAKLGFFGFDDSTGRMTFIPDATNTSEVFSGTLGDIELGAVYTDLISEITGAGGRLDYTTTSFFLTSDAGTGSKGFVYGDGTDFQSGHVDVGQLDFHKTSGDNQASLDLIVGGSFRPHILIEDTSGNAAVMSGTSLQGVIINSGSTINAGVTKSVIIGGSGIVAAANDTVYVPDLVIQSGKSLSIGANQVLGAQAAAEPDPGAITSYTAHASGAVTVTSNAATDLDTTAAALAVLEDEVTAVRATLASLLAKDRTHGFIAT